MSPEIYYAQETKHLLFQPLPCSLYYSFFPENPGASIVLQSVHGQIQACELWKFFLRNPRAVSGFNSLFCKNSEVQELCVSLFKKSAFNRDLHCFQDSFSGSLRFLYISSSSDTLEADSFNGTSWERQAPKPASKWV